MVDTMTSAARAHRVLAAMILEQHPQAEIAERLTLMAHVLGDPKLYSELWRRVEASPRIVCLCGSTRFWRDYLEANQRETLAGNIVLTVGFFVHTEAQVSGTRAAFREVTPEIKRRLDELHLRKIDMADEVFVINRDGYIGESTRAELAYARKLGKPVRSLEPLEEADVHS